ncbi:hypothetical protein QB607_002862 [Clostridium botulinum]|nr:hypothetical protein [Clostridium botulinum]EKS4395338.1 hypothetical protein [Clostridium botulinum]
MSTKKIRCFTFDLKQNDTKCNGIYLKELINELYLNVSGTSKEETIIYRENKDADYLSLERLEKFNTSNNKHDYGYFRIGRQKDIDGAIKRNLNTLEGKEILDENEQGVYELEICTYILVDFQEGIILELYGQFAPTIKSFANILNKKLNGYEIHYKNILTEDLINILKKDGDRINKINYNYEVADVSILQKLGLTSPQVVALEELGIFEIEITLKNRPRIPLTKKIDKIKHVIEVLSQSPKKIKDTIGILGKTKNSASKEYKFTEQEVTFNIGISDFKNQDGMIIKLSLDEIAEEVYNRMEGLYIKNKSNILEYI